MTRTVGPAMAGTTTEWLVEVHLNLIKLQGDRGYTFAQLRDKVSPIRPKSSFVDFFHAHLRAKLTATTVVDAHGRNIVYFTVGPVKPRLVPSRRTFPEVPSVLTNTGDKVVQTTVPISLYRRLALHAIAAHTTITKVLRTALEEYLDKQDDQ